MFSASSSPRTLQFEMKVPSPQHISGDGFHFDQRMYKHFRQSHQGETVSGVERISPVISGIALSNMWVLPCLILFFPDSRSWPRFSISIIIIIIAHELPMSHSQHRYKVSSDHVRNHSHIKAGCLFIVRSVPLKCLSYLKSQTLFFPFFFF